MQRTSKATQPDRRSLDDVFTEEKKHMWCPKFEKGACERGDRCLFGHDMSLPTVPEYLGPRTDKGKGKGKGKGNKGGPPLLNKDELKKTLCPFFMDGKCKKGDGSERGHDLNLLSIAEYRKLYKISVAAWRV